MPTFIERLQHGWNAFTNNKDPTPVINFNTEYSYASRPDKYRATYSTERSLVSSIYNQIARDAAAVSIRHVKTNENGKIVGYINSYLDKALTINANRDQTSREFIQDAVYSMFDEGVIAIIPTETDINPEISTGFDVMSMRTAKILEWYPDKVKVQFYNEQIGKKQTSIFPKSMVAICTNPLYEIMNSPNSTLKRLVRKLNLLDAVDEQSSSGKLDLIIQLPYTIKSETRREQAAQRKRDIEMQLTNSKYGIAYTDATEHVTQLNRPADNNLMAQVEYLTSMLYNQLGMTEDIFKGTADEKVMLNYQNRTIEPILSAIVDPMNWKFLSKTARTKGEAIRFFKDPFKLVPVSQIAEIADKFTRNEILSPNEIRSIIGYMPDDDPKSDELRNRNISMSKMEQTNQNLSNEKEEIDLSKIRVGDL